MYTSDWNVNVVQQLMKVFHFQTGTKEHHHFLVSVLPKEGEQQHEPFLRRTNNVALEQQLNTFP